MLSVGNKSAAFPWLMRIEADDVPIITYTKSFLIQRIYLYSI